MSDTSVCRCIGGAAVNKNRVCAVIVLLVFGAFGAAVAVADEMTVAPALSITGPTNWRPWSGVYFGLNAGYAWSSSSVSYAANDPAAQAGTCGGVGHSQCIPWADYYTQGALFGGQIGYNYQIDSIWVAGVEADYQWADLTGQGVSRFPLGYTSPTTTSVNTSATVDQSVKSFGTVRLRLGVASANRFSFTAPVDCPSDSLMQTSICRPAGRARFLPEAVTLIAAAPQVRPVFPAQRRSRRSGGR